MPWWASLIGAGLKVLGLVDMVVAWGRRWADRRAGAAEQKARDDAATVETDKAARAIDDAVARLPDAELDRRLRAGPPG